MDAGVRMGRAQQTLGVLAVLTGEDWATEKFGAPRPIIPRHRRDGSPMFVPSRPALAKDRAMLVGDPIAFVGAEDRLAGSGATSPLRLTRYWRKSDSNR